MQILQSIYEKLKIETKKVTILKLFQRLPINQFTNMDVTIYLQKTKAKIHFLSYLLRGERPTLPLGCSIGLVDCSFGAVVRS